MENKQQKYVNTSSPTPFPIPMVLGRVCVVTFVPQLCLKPTLGYNSGNAQSTVGLAAGAAPSLSPACGPLIVEDHFLTFAMNFQALCGLTAFLCRHFEPWCQH